MTHQWDYEADGATLAYERTLAYDARGLVTGDTAYTKRAGGLSKSVTTNGYGAGADYALGAVVTQDTAQYEASPGATQMTLARRSTTTTSYGWSDAARVARIVHTPDTAAATRYTTTNAYAADGALVSTTIADGRPRTVGYASDLDGRLLRRDEADANAATGDPHAVWYRFDGRQMGSATNDARGSGGDYAGSVDDRQAVEGTGAFRLGAGGGVYDSGFAQGPAGIDSTATGSEAGSYTVRGGDTLAGIAQQLWGDAGLWYKLADANGLGAGTSLAAGQTLRLPAGVLRSAYSDATLSPYDHAAAIGDIQPTTPQPPAPRASHSKKHCGGFGTVLLAVVAVAVTVATSGFLGPVGGAVAGNVASQAVGVATGIQDKFSFKSVALTAITAGVTQGLSPGGALGGQAGAFSKLGSQLAIDVARGAAANAITQGVALATGLQSKFDFAGVAAAGVGAGVGGGIARGLRLTGFEVDRSLGNVAGQALAGTASAIAGAATRSALEGSSFGDNVRRAIPDAIGQTVGRLAAAALQGPSQAAIAKAAADPVAQATGTVGAEAEAAARGGGGWVNSEAIARAVDDALLRDGPLAGAVGPQLAEALIDFDSTNRAIAAMAQTREYYQSLSPTEQLNFQSTLGILPPSRTGPAGGPDVLKVDDRRDAMTFAELAVWEERIRVTELAHGGAYSNSATIHANFARNEQDLINAYARADGEVNKLLFVSLGGPALLAAGGVLAPLAGAYAGGAGGLAYYATSFGVGGAAGATFEYSKNRVFGLQDTPGGYVGSVLGGGIGGTGLQVLSSGAPQLLNNIATGGFLGVIGNGAGQYVDTKFGYANSFDFRDVVMSGAIGAAAGGAVPLEFRINGLNAGRNNSVAVYNGLQTRLNNGNIGQFRLRYGVAAGVGRGVRGVGQDAAGKLYTGIYEDANR